MLFGDIEAYLKQGSQELAFSPADAAIIVEKCKEAKQRKVRCAGYGSTDIVAKKNRKTGVISKHCNGCGTFFTSKILLCTEKTNKYSSSRHVIQICLSPQIVDEYPALGLLSGPISLSPIHSTCGSLIIFPLEYVVYSSEHSPSRPSLSVHSFEIARGKLLEG